MLATINIFVFICLNLNLVYGEGLPTSCGRQHTVSPDWRIVGGENAAAGEFPWQIMLIRDFYNEDGQHMRGLCGGTILNSQWMLTAAHCVKESHVTSEYTVNLGIHSLDQSEGTERRASVAKIIQHASFDAQAMHNDVALIKISGTLDFKGAHNFLEPICLANSSMSSPTNCVATGFGYRNAQGSQVHTLQKVSEPIVADSHCTRVHDDYDSKANICAGGSQFGGTGTCMGDSGGPLQCKASDGRFYQWGITSYGIPCAKANDPDVFTRVSTYVSWIKNQISNN